MYIAPSILDANFGALQSELNSVATANRIHLDVMDGHYVPNITFGASIFRQVTFPSPVEVHLMVNHPAVFLEYFLPLNPHTMTFHIEATGLPQAKELLKYLQSKGVKGGVSIDGYTEAAYLDDEILALADQVLIMSVKSGFGGQSFLPESLEKCKTLRARGFAGEVEFDGGVKRTNVEAIKAAGADIVVVGSGLMKQPAADRPGIIADFQSV